MVLNLPLPAVPHQQGMRSGFANIENGPNSPVIAPLVAIHCIPGIPGSIPNPILLNGGIRVPVRAFIISTGSMRLVGLVVLIVLIVLIGLVMNAFWRIVPDPNIADMSLTTPVPLWPLTMVLFPLTTAPSHRRSIVEDVKTGGRSRSRYPGVFSPRG